MQHAGFRESAGGANPIGDRDGVAPFGPDIIHDQYPPPFQKIVRGELDEFRDGILGLLRCLDAGEVSRETNRGGQDIGDV